MVGDEKLFAWLDGELEPAEAARVQAEVERDPRLSALAAEHRAMKAKLNSAFDTLLVAPLPRSILSAMEDSGPSPVIDIAVARKRREKRSWSPFAQWASMAATLALGVLLGTALPYSRGTGPIRMENGKVYAAAALNRALDTQLASAPAGDVRIGLTFRNHGGAICRSFSNAQSSGLACRADGRWQIRGIFAAPPGQSTDYRMAAGADPALSSLIDSTMAGEPFDAAGEAAARAHHWR